ncbi:MAG: metallophosphoesterase [Anaerolineae bacterium]
MTRWRYGLFALACLLAAVWGFYAFAVEPLSPRLEEVWLPMPDLPPQMEELRIVQVSDIHMIQPGLREARARELIERLQPDLVVVTGDLIEATVDPARRLERLEAVLTWLEGLPARYGVWATRGNTDITRYADQNNAYLDRVAGSSVHFLVSRWERLEVGEGTLYLAGADFASFPRGWFSSFDWSLGPEGPTAVVREARYNSYTHYATRAAMGWQNYTFRGIMGRTDARSGLGVTAYSQFPEGGDRYYRLRAYREWPTFHIAPHGTSITQGKVDTGVEARPGLPWAFALQVESRPEGTWVRARVWEAGQPEPEGWQAACLDEGVSRLTQGTVGLWAVGRGEQRFSALEVRRNDGALLWPAQERPGERWVDFGYNEGHVRLAVEGMPADGPRLLLAHGPDQVREAAALGLPAMLAGHTHGGQVQIPFVGAVFKQNTLGGGYVSGLLEWGETTLYTSRGLGVRSGFPARFLAPPEITLVHLVRR